MKSLAEEIDRLKGVMSENPRSLHFARLAEYLLQSEEVDEAVKVCQDGLEYHSQYANAHFVLGICHFHKGDLDAAESEFNKALLYDSEHLNAHHYQAKIMKERDWQNAYVLWLKRALAIDPMDRMARSMLDEFEEGREAEDAVAEEEPTVVIEEEAGPELETSDQLKEVEKAFSDESGEEEAVAVEQEPSEEETEVAAEPVEKEEEVVEPATDEKRYEFILDDIFKEETSEEDKIAEEREDISDVTEEVIEEPLEEDEEESTALFEEEVDEVKTEEQPTVEPAESQVETEEEPASETPAEEREKAADEIFGEEVEDDDLLEEEGEIEEEIDEEVIEEEAEVEEKSDLIEEVLPEQDEEVEEPVVEEAGESTRKEPFVTATLGEIYAAQGHYGKAIGVYEILLRKDPDNQHYKAKIKELAGKMEDEKD